MTTTMRIGEKTLISISEQTLVLAGYVIEELRARRDELMRFDDDDDCATARWEERDDQ
jgi:hypothetical protein